MKRSTWVLWVVCGLIFAGFASISLGGYIGWTNCIPSFIKAYKATSASSFLVPLVTLLVSLGVGLFTLAGLLLASVNIKWGLSFQSVVKLQEDEGAYEQAKAKQLVSAALKIAHQNTNSNVYCDVRKYIKALKYHYPKQYEELDKARRHLTTFWYKAAVLADLGVIKPKNIFYNVGPPDNILEILEPLEAIHIELFIDPNWKPRPWPPMLLVIARDRWWWMFRLRSLYKKKWCDKEGRQLRCEVPARRELYNKSK